MIVCQTIFKPQTPKYQNIMYLGSKKSLLKLLEGEPIVNFISAYLFYNL